MIFDILLDQKLQHVPLPTVILHALVVFFSTMFGSLINIKLNYINHDLECLFRTYFCFLLFSGILICFFDLQK